MGLAAHLEGVMNGTLRPSAKTATYWVVLYTTYVNWLMTTLTAVFGTGALSDNRISQSIHSAHV
jgi:hydroxylaminobenzene mutase